MNSLNNNFQGDPLAGSYSNTDAIATPDNNNNLNSSYTPKSFQRRDSKIEPGQTVERKRRDNINEKIQELGTIIPKNFFDNNKEKSSGTKDGKPNKGQILSKSIEYIEYLQNKIDENNKKEIEFLLVLKKLEEIKRLPDELKPSKTQFKHTSAEIELQRIGVGPLAEDSKNNNASNEGSNVNSANVATTRINSGTNNSAMSRLNSPSNNIDNKRSSVASIGSPLVANVNNNETISNTVSPNSVKPESRTSPFTGSNTNAANFGALNSTYMDQGHNFSQQGQEENIGDSFTNNINSAHINALNNNGGSNGNRKNGLNFARSENFDTFGFNFDT